MSFTKEIRVKRASAKHYEPDFKNLTHISTLSVFSGVSIQMGNILLGDGRISSPFICGRHPFLSEQDNYCCFVVVV